MAIVGYTRVSTLDQNLHSQIDAPSAAGAVKKFRHKLTGKNAFATTSTTRSSSTAPTDSAGR